MSCWLRIHNPRFSVMINYSPRKLESMKVARRTRTTISMAVRELTVASSGT